MIRKLKDRKAMEIEGFQTRCGSMEERYGGMSLEDL